MGTSWDRPPRARLVTISAAYGAAGSVVAPRVAERLGLPFADRLIPARGGPSSSPAAECMTDEERDQVAKGAFLARLAHLTGGLNFPVPGAEDLHDQVRSRVEASIGQIAATAGGVILGRAGAIVLAGDPRAFHVRLDGPERRRLAQAMQMEHVDEETARARMNETDRARTRYVSRLYGRDVADPRLYHLLVDSTALPLEGCVDLVAAAATSFWDRLCG